MEEKKINTETLADEYNYIDELSDGDAFDFMISNQKKAFDSVKVNKSKIIKTIKILVNKLSKNKVLSLMSKHINELN